MYNWFKIINKTEFLATGLVSRTVTLNLEGIGQRDILVTIGHRLGITYDGVLLTPELNGLNPFAFDGYAAYIDANNDVYLGIEIES